jgi:hypothetical protein
MIVGKTSRLFLTRCSHDDSFFFISTCDASSIYKQRKGDANHEPANFVYSSGRVRSPNRIVCFSIVRVAAKALQSGPEYEWSAKYPRPPQYTAKLQKARSKFLLRSPLRLIRTPAEGSDRYMATAKYLIHDGWCL